MNKTCTNHPGAVDHNTAECPWNTEKTHGLERGAAAQKIDCMCAGGLAGAPTVKAEQVKTGAEWVMRLLDTGEWRLTRFRNDPSMTEDYCRRNSWQVERQCAPYCGDNEVTFWRAETAEQAFTAAINDLFPGRAAEFGRPAPSLPAAGSAVEEVEVVAHFLIPKAGSHAGEKFAKTGLPASSLNADLYATEPLMTVAQHERIVAAYQEWVDARGRALVGLEQIKDAEIDQLRAALSAQQSAPVTGEPSPLEVIGYASPGQIEILRELPRTGGMKVKGRKDDRYSEPVVLLSDARAAMISLAARCQQEGAFKTCLECGYQDGHDEICQFHASNRTEQQSAPERVSVPVELLKRSVDRWACCSMAQTPGAEEAWAELRALLASHGRGEA